MGLDCVEVRESPIHGVGVFATRPFRQGERIRLVHELRVVDGEHPLRRELGEYEHHQDYYPDRTVLLGFPDRHFNHACEPNAYDRWDQRGGREKVALRPIAAGEEITSDYCINSWGDTVWTCNCEAPTCRRTISADFFALPVDLQLRYLPLVADWYERAFPEPMQALRRLAS